MNVHSQTRAVRSGIDCDPTHGAVLPPIDLSVNYSFAEFNEPRQYDYTRSGNPTRDLLADTLAELEGGVGAVVTASGMAAIALVLQTLDRDDLLVIPHDCYGGSHRLFQAWAQKKAFRLVTIDVTDSRNLADVLGRKPAMVWIETPSNPLLRITDIRRVVREAHHVGALVVADNTFLSPALQQPLSLGVDVVVHSTTKYINGHSDVVGGAVIAADPEIAEELDWWANAIGLGGAPFDSFLTLRGVRTLGARLRTHEENATALAEALAEHPVVRAVHYPGLTSHPQHALASRQQRGFGGMLSFELYGGEPAVKAFLHGLTCFTLAESLGGVESLVAHPATMTHASMPEEARLRAGIRDGLLRLSVGIEDVRDLVADVNAGLDRARAVTTNDNGADREAHLLQESKQEVYG